MNIKDELLKLDKDELYELLTSMLESKTQSKETKKRKQRRRSNIDKDEEQPIVQRGGRRQRRRPVISTDKKPQRQKPAMAQPVQTGKRQNMFIQQIRNTQLDKQESNELQRASTADKITNKNRQPIQRRKAVEFLEVECKGGCGYIYEVPASLIFIEAGEPVYYCDDCASRHR